MTRTHVRSIRRAAMQALAALGLAALLGGCVAYPGYGYYGPGYGYGYPAGGYAVFGGGWAGMAMMATGMAAVVGITEA